MFVILKCVDVNVIKNIKKLDLLSDLSPLPQLQYSKIK